MLPAVRITYCGHACLLVEAAGSRLLIDPGAFSPQADGLAGLDVLALTHQHTDHMVADRLRGLLDGNPGVQLLAEPEAAQQLVGQGFSPRTLAAGETVTVGPLTLEAVGGRHAQIHAGVPTVGNVGILVRAPGEPVLFHPGDSYAQTPGGVDLLAVPLSSPWAALGDTVDFVRAVRPRVAVPIHDALLSPGGRGLFMTLLGQLAPDSDLRDVAQAPVELAASVQP